MDTKPVVSLDFDGPGGNTMAMIAACKRAARKAGWPNQTFDAFVSEALCDSREHALDVIFECFEVVQERRVIVGADRNEVR